LSSRSDDERFASLLALEEIGKPRPTTTAKQQGRPRDTSFSDEFEHLNTDTQSSEGSLGWIRKIFLVPCQHYSDAWTGNVPLRLLWASTRCFLPSELSLHVTRAWFRMHFVWASIFISLQAAIFPSEIETCSHNVVDSRFTNLVHAHQPGRLATWKNGMRSTIMERGQDLEAEDCSNADFHSRGRPSNCPSPSTVLCRAAT
jgi:hypothetical protein